MKRNPLGSSEMRAQFDRVMVDYICYSIDQVQTWFHDGGDDIDYLGGAGSLISILTRLVVRPFPSEWTKEQLDKLFQDHSWNEGLAREGLGDAPVDEFLLFLREWYKFIP